MTLGRLRLLIQHLFLLMTLAAGRLGLVLTGKAMPCLSCSLVFGGCNGCVLRYFQVLMSFLAGPVSWGSPEGLDHLQTLGILLVLCLTLGRLWCGWLCPFGLVQDWLFALGRALGLGRGPLSGPALKCLTVFRYSLLTILLLFPPLVETGIIHPDYIYAFCQLCPGGTVLPLLAGQGRRLAWDASSPVSGLVTGLSLTLTGFILGWALTLTRPWCHVCPVPLLSRVFHKVRLVRLKREPSLCSGCRNCLKICPMEGTPALAANRAEDCLGCGRCLVKCPIDGCLSLTLTGQVDLVRSGRHCSHQR
ncbi:MAG: 4Fe-4S binding protein [Deltaproteobacteria bacterium]|jgi:polyferredoxin|nr:4Fe-4S binding protein [Deltaproteobacteria bacterium]